MGLDPNGRLRPIPPEGRLNVFALVIYIPEPLGTFLDDLRRELVPHYNPHAHVSVLPPRPLSVDWQTASQQVQALAENWPPFDVELTEVAVFPGTDVVYIEVGAGARELRGMHSAMNCRSLACSEPYPYHPHITLAQEVPHDDVPAAYELASRRWKEFPGPKQFRADRAVFVQNTAGNIWIDLAEYPLGSVALRSPQ
jgi:2'-5' RNA ligase